MSDATSRLATLVFSHGNGFVGGTYNKIFEALRAVGYEVHAIERLGHNPNYPVTNNWPHLVSELADFATQKGGQSDQGVYLVGHSLGGILSLMCAAQHPRLGRHRVRGVIMLDSPLVAAWRSPALALIKQTPLINRVSPARGSRRRRQQWPSREAVFESFQKKPHFAAWDPDVLRDYVAHGFREVGEPEGSHVELAFSRDVETAIYNSLPHDVPRLLKRHPLQAPLAFIRGTRSSEMRQLGEGPLRRLVGTDPGDRWQDIEGSHLYPMERPLETAERIHRALLAMAPAQLSAT